MGIKQFRERALARADALSARADRMDAELASEKAARVEAREQARVDGDLEVLRAQARSLGEVHDDLSARAVAVGLPSSPHAGIEDSVLHTGLRPLLPAHSLLTLNADVSRSGRADPYKVWCARIVLEERIAAKVARGEKVSRWDRAQRLTARVAST